MHLEITMIGRYAAAVPLSLARGPPLFNATMERSRLARFSATESCSVGDEVKCRKEPMARQQRQGRRRTRLGTEPKKPNIRLTSMVERFCWAGNPTFRNGFGYRWHGTGGKMLLPNGGQYAAPGVKWEMSAKDVRSARRDKLMITGQLRPSRRFCIQSAGMAMQSNSVTPFPRRWLRTAWCNGV